MENAPYYDEIAEGPKDARAYWARTRDGVRIRLGLFQTEAKKSIGTILLFPGRTEYIEKYGRTGADFAGLGYTTLTIDWRGQGLSDRACENALVGHVRDYAEYQVDIAAMLDAAKALDLPRPFYLLSHSMGGCIALRALHEGLDVKAAIFSAPMWGISMAPALRPVAWASSWVSHTFGKGCGLAPGTSPETYVKNQAFEDNELTTDPQMYAYLQRQAHVQPDLTLAGPSMSWLYTALVETRALARLPAPPVKTLTFLGTHERIVQPGPVHDLMGRWKDGELAMIDGAEHEVLMEQAKTRAEVNTRLHALFSGTS